MGAPDGGGAPRVRGIDVLQTPLLNKGTAFTREERAALGLEGLLPPRVLSLEEQVRRAYGQYRAQQSDLLKNVYLTLLHDRNEVLFYRLLTDHLAEMLPIIYAPTVGEVIRRYSHEYRGPRGLYLSIDRFETIETALSNLGLGADDVDLIVASDGEQILGIGDWGVGGIAIAIAKVTVYTAGAGIHPARALPVVLDVGTDNDELLADPDYLGNRHPRVRGQRYDDFIEAFVSASTRRYPNVVLHWEDFGAANGRRILERYKDRVCTFNDDMQGTGAVVLAAALAGARAGGIPLREQRVVIFGAGTAGMGIADQLCDAMVRAGSPRDEAVRRIWALDKDGLLTDDKPGLWEYQAPYARPVGEVAAWRRADRGPIGLAEVVAAVRPTMLIGTSTAPGAFSEEIVRALAEQTERPVIFPLSNPTERMEAHPEDLIRWTDGRALVATGIPVEPIRHGGVTHVIGQANNGLLYPGLGLGAVVARAARISDGMLTAAAEAVAHLVGSDGPGASLLPPVEDLRTVSAAVAAAVAERAVAEGLARTDLDDVGRRVGEAMWRPEYRPVTPS